VDFKRVSGRDPASRPGVYKRKWLGRKGRRAAAFVWKEAGNFLVSGIVRGSRGGIGGWGVKTK